MEKQEQRPLLTLGEQILLGALVSVPVVLGILTQSVMSALNALLSLFIISGIPLLVVIIKRVNYPRLGRAVLVLWAVFMMFMVALGFERVYFSNGNSYPDWLATGTVNSESDGVALCKGRGAVEIIEKEEMTVIRCGMFLPDAKTYLLKGVRHDKQ